MQSVSKSSSSFPTTHDIARNTQSRANPPVYHKHPLHKERARAREYNRLARVHRLFWFLKRILSIHVHAHKS